MKTSLIVLGVVVASILVGTLVRRWKNRHVGIGVILSRRKDGRTFVESRLLRSPSGRAKIPIGARVVSWNEFPMQFSTHEEFQRIWKDIRPKNIGESISLIYEFREEKTSVTMTAEMIQGPIPVYGPPLAYPQDDEWRFKRGVRLCRKTGQWVPTHRLSEAALNLIFSR